MAVCERLPSTAGQLSEAQSAMQVQQSRCEALEQAVEHGQETLARVERELEALRDAQ